MAHNFSQLKIQKQKSFCFTLAIPLHLIILVTLLAKNLGETFNSNLSFSFQSASMKCALMFHASWIYLHIKN